MSKNSLSINRRVKRNKTILRIVFIVFVMFLLLSGTFVVAINTQRFKIKNISIEGLSSMPEEEVMQTVESVLGGKLLALVTKDSYFLFSEKKTEEILIDKFKRLSSVEIKKEFPESILITAVERKPEAIVCQEQEKSCLFVDDTGYIYEDAPYFSSGVFLRFVDLRDSKPLLGSYLVSELTYKKIVEFANWVDEFFKITEVHITNDGIYEFFTENGPKLIVEKNDDWAFSFENLTVFMGETESDAIDSLEYIDLRFGKKVFYKYK